jgi:ADP-L-glycero-D-manno-heptose 6-epimerase
MMDGIAEKYFGKMHIVGLRYFNVFGPNEAHKERPASMIYHLTKQMKSGQRPRIFKYGEQKRDHIYVKDAVEATIKALNAPSGIYNVGTGIATSFNELIKILNEVLKTNYEPEYIDNPYEGTYQNHTQADTTKAEKFLKFRARYQLRDAIKEYAKMIC